MSEVVIYTSPSCPWCTKLKDYLDEKGVGYQEIDVSEDYNAAMKMVDLTGQRSVPVLMKGEQYVIGYNPEQIDRILQ
ncbi:MAG TPA: glutaredoxin family protein [Bacillota bacterium]|jgi:glutaredoxin 3|nr:glutaredoxin family protein [Bacillota bacterium]HOL10881.1 glutaredoxin family protein [Bacillota bacterium]HPO96524.1 glutaredoxin family protein [Bacillota bacterium]